MLLTIWKNKPPVQHAHKYLNRSMMMRFFFLKKKDSDLPSLSSLCHFVILSFSWWPPKPPFLSCCLCFHLKCRSWHWAYERRWGKQPRASLFVDANCGNGPFLRWGDSYRPTLNASKWTLTRIWSKTGRTESAKSLVQMPLTLLFLPWSQEKHAWAESSLLHWAY